MLVHYRICTRQRACRANCPAGSLNAGVSAFNRNPLCSIAASAAAAVGTIAAAATAVGMIVIAAVGITRIDKQAVGNILLGREKLVDRELEVCENLTGVLLSANTAVRAVAARQADIKRRHEQLDIALQTNDRELTQGDEKLVSVIAQHQIVTVKA